MAAHDQHMQDGTRCLLLMLPKLPSCLLLRTPTIGTIIAKTGNRVMPMVQQSVLVSVNTFLKATIAALAMQPSGHTTILRQLLTSDEPPVRDVITFA